MRGRASYHRVRSIHPALIPFPFSVLWSPSPSIMQRLWGYALFAEHLDARTMLGAGLIVDGSPLLARLAGFARS